VVADGACVAVEALAFQEHVMGAARFPVALVLSAVIAVIAGRLIGEPIAVVIEAVTDLRRRLDGSAISKSLGSADADAGALPGTVLCMAGRRQGRVDREVGARTHPSRVDALEAQAAVGG
jgi:hypothetical protein